jgi:acyl-CoA reductase-like NAD-dependent aldehyde dehydrogenase
MGHVFRAVSPVDGAVFDERGAAELTAVGHQLDVAVKAYAAWRRVPLEERLRALTAFVDAVEARAPELARELAIQMGRPVSQTPGEIRGFVDRGRTMIRLAPEGLASIVPGPKPGFNRYITREPLGVVLALAPWNYPWLCAVNTIVPALAAGNVVLLKHSDQTPLVPERLLEAARAAGLPAGVFQVAHTTHDVVADVVKDPRVAFVAFTGSVEGGRAVHRAAAGTFKSVGLELGGKDPAYVRADADLGYAIENVVDGAFFNSGQSCCAVERVYVHRDVYAAFVEGASALVSKYRLGNPLDADTNLGPVVRASNAATIRAQLRDALSRGARPLIDEGGFSAARDGTPYVAPQLLVDVTDDMPVMAEETFGPLVGVAPVDSDDEAIARMNHSRYGLTASIWTRDTDAAVRIGEQLETGTVFQNRCDALDPELAWVGVKDSGRGVTLSRVGYEPLTRPKSFHLRLET